MNTNHRFSRLALIAAASLLTLGASFLQASPLIFVQPNNATAFVGDASATFKVQATGDATWESSQPIYRFDGADGERIEVFLEFS